MMELKVGRIYRERMVNTLKEEASRKEVTILINFHSLKSNQINTLRNSLKEKEARLRVSKNRLIKRSFSLLNLNVEEFLEGETGLVYISQDKLVEVVKFLFGFRDEAEGLQIKGGRLLDKFLSFEELKEISKLPSRQVLLAMTVGTIGSPLCAFLNSLSQIILKLLWVIEEIRKKEEPDKSESKS